MLTTLIQVIVLWTVADVHDRRREPVCVEHVAGIPEKPAEQVVWTSARCRRRMCPRHTFERALRPRMRTLDRRPWLVPQTGWPGIC